MFPQERKVGYVVILTELPNIIVTLSVPLKKIFGGYLDAPCV